MAGPLLEPLSLFCHNSWQLLQSFEDIPLCSILQQIQEKHDLQKVKKVRAGGLGRSAAPGWGILPPFSLVPGILF